MNDEKGNFARVLYVNDESGNFAKVLYVNDERGNFARVLYVNEESGNFARLMLLELKVMNVYCQSKTLISLHHATKSVFNR